MSAKARRTTLPLPGMFSFRTIAPAASARCTVQIARAVVIDVDDDSGDGRLEVFDATIRDGDLLIVAGYDRGDSGAVDPELVDWHAMFTRRWRPTRTGYRGGRDVLQQSFKLNIYAPGMSSR